MNETYASPHLNKSDFELYVINALAEAHAAEVESHVACCEACADALAREAQLEMALDLLAERTSFEVEIVHAKAAPVLDTLPQPAPFAVTPALPRHALRVVPFVPASSSASGAVSSGASSGVAHRRTRTGIAFAGALAAAAALVMWIMPSAKSDANDDVATYGAVSADAAGAMVSFDHDVKPNLDKLDGG